MRTGSVGLAAACALCACGHLSSVRPAPKGEIQPELQLGGPFLNAPGKLQVPLPLATVGARYGLGDRVDVSANAHLTPLLFGVAGLDVGSTYLALEEQRPWPALSVGGRLYGFTDLPPSGGPRAYLEGYGSASYLFRGIFMPYLSASVLVQFAGGMPIPSLAAGAQLVLGRFAVQLEARWYSPTVPSSYMVVDWWNVGGYGAWGALAGVSYRFGGER